MTVSTEVSRIIAAGNNVTVTFTYTFPIIGASDTDQTNARLVYTDTTGVSTTMADNLWSITGVVTQPTDWASGTFRLSTSTPITTGSTLTLERTQPYLQSTTLGNQGSYSPETVEAALDFLALQTEQLNTWRLQSLRAPITDAALDELPTAALRANSFLYFDSSGDVTTASSTSGIPINTGGLIGIRVFKTAGTTTYTPTSGANSVVIYLCGAGAGGGGAAANPGSGTPSWGLGGSGGAWLMKRLTSAFSGKQIVVGAKGAGGTAGANNGGAGGNSTFDAVGANYIARGGTSGFGGKGPVGNYILPAGQDGAAPTASNGDINVSGDRGGFTVNISANNSGIGGSGGNSPWGSCGIGGYVGGSNTSQAGVAAQGNGAGGGGGISTGTSAAAVAGGDGTDGVCIIYEYS